MRIAIFIKNTIYHGGFGGLETQNENLVTGLIKAGQDITVFAPSLGKIVPGYIFVSGTTPGRYDKNWWQLSLEEFKKRHQEKPFDIVISQSAAGASVISQAEELNVKTIVIAHGTILGELRTVWRKSKTIIDYLRLPRTLAFGAKTYFLLDRDYLRGCDRIVAVSEAVKDALLHEFGLKSVKVKVVPNGVDLSKFLVASQMTPNVNFLYYGRLEKEKGLEVLVAAFRQVIASSSRVKLTIVGDGHFKEDLSKLIIGVPAVSLREATTYDQIPGLLSSANVFVFPTLRVEGLPMTLVESAAAGLPIVATAIGGNKEVVTNGLNGYLVKSNNSIALAEAMLKLSDNLELREEMGLASRKLAEERFGIESMTKGYLEIISNL